MSPLGGHRWSHQPGGQIANNAVCLLASLRVCRVEDTAMRKTIGLAFAVAFGGAAFADGLPAAPATPPTPPTVATAPAPAGQQPSDTVVCKVYEAPTGTMIGSRKVCMTKAQWAVTEHNTKDSIWRAQTGVFGSAGGSSMSGSR